METYYVYHVCNPEHTNILSEGYIGVTTNLNRRFQEHRGRFKDKGDLSFSVVDSGTESEMSELEFKLRPESNIGWNITVGGKTTSADTRNNISSGMKDSSGCNNPFFGRKHTEEAKKKQSENNYMLGRTGELAPNWGKKWSDESRKKLSRSRRKYVYHTPNGVFTSSWEAANSNKCSRSTIEQRCLNDNFQDYFRTSIH
ncbi:NUMOD3 domain-containing DNA-binding protein [Endozoicomonas sp. ALB115]|uniref:NUMOD3 domain-containing DNA-binding protein n=1 Tax=Endozoicomonas sp. ALB115 TaxID=3403074 RepID=UPI003BB578BC